MLDPVVKPREALLRG
ncbi:MAG TPA: hypothetical protein LFW10_01265 [Rickettsia endosymbiont of Diachasma alloeum]|nr:hypothetical protein [Rickettsia endosymbiont of Diachasma alloeum]